MQGTSKNAAAAAVSLPSQLRRETAVDRDRWVWRTPLEKSQPFWWVLCLDKLQSQSSYTALHTPCSHALWNDCDGQCRRD